MSMAETGQRFNRRTGCGPKPADDANGKPRLNCACGASVVRQPWMRDADWLAAGLNFGRLHRVKAK